MTSKLEHLSSLILNYFSRAMMRRFILCLIYNTFSSIHMNIFSIKTQGLLTISLVMAMVLWLFYHQSRSLETPHNILKETYFDTNMIHKLSWILHLCRITPWDLAQVIFFGLQKNFIKCLKLQLKVLNPNLPNWDPLVKMVL